MANITPSPKVNKTFDPPLAAQPIPIRTGSLSPTPSPTRSYTNTRLNRAAGAIPGLHNATSLLGMRGINHLRSLTMPRSLTSGALPLKGGGGGGGFGTRRSDSGSSSGSNSSSTAPSRKRGVRGERPLVIGMPFFDDADGLFRDAIGPEHLLPPRACELRVAGLPPGSLPALSPRASAIRIPSLDPDHFDGLQAKDSFVPEQGEPPEEQDHKRASNPFEASWDTPQHFSYTGNDSPSAKRVGGVERWHVASDIDQVALRDALENHHPDPLNYNPPSDDDEDEPTRPWEGGPLSPQLGPGKDDLNPYWTEVLTPSPKGRSRHVAAPGVPPQTICKPVFTCPSPASTQSQATDPCACGDALVELKHEITTLRAGNSALMTLKAAHEETISLLHGKIHTYDNTLAKLNWQVQAKEKEQISIIDDFGAEIYSQNREMESLREDKWHLMGEIVQLEKRIAALDGSVRCGSVSARGENLLGNTGDDGGASLIESPSKSNAPVLNLPQSSNGELETPTTLRSSMFSPRLCSSASNRSLYAATPAPSCREGPSTRASLNAGDDRCSWNDQSPRSAHSQLIGIVGESQAGSSGGDHAGRFSRESQIMTAQIVLAAKARLEESLCRTQEKLAEAEARGHELQVQLATNHATQGQPLSSTCAGPKPMSSAFMPIPDLTILTYTKPFAVWNDRLLTCFKYLGLLDFIERDVPRPETSTWDATEVADWTSRRMRAVVLLKHAVNDDILEDVLHVNGRRETFTGPREFDRSAPILEDPHQLFATITRLRRIISPSATDPTWLDRIEDADFDGIEGFTSLFLCIDKRHSVMYGTSTDRYDALLPKLQHTMARLFPELKGATFAAEDSVANLPKKPWQLSVWMAKVVKRQQICDDC